MENPYILTDHVVLPVYSNDNRTWDKRIGRVVIACEILQGVTLLAVTALFLYVAFPSIIWGIVQWWPL